MNIVCLGDSITEATEVAPPQCWTQLLAEHLENWRPGDFTVHNLGIGGQTSTEGRARLESEVAPLLPGVLLVEFGLNDANVYDWTDAPRVALKEFAENLRFFHAYSQQRQGLCVFIANHLIGPVTGQQGNKLSYEENFAPYNPMVRQVAAELGAACIDLPAMLTERGLTAKDMVLMDGIHLSAEGNRVYAELVYSHLRKIIKAIA